MTDLPESGGGVSFVYLWGERLYTEADNILFVYSLSDLTSPSATYAVGDDQKCYSALITDSRLYIGGVSKLHIFKVTPSFTEPLTPVTKIPTKGSVYKILRVGDDLLMG